MASNKGAKRHADDTHRENVAGNSDQLVSELKKDNLVLRDELQARQEELDVQAEELEAQLEELRANNEELERQIEERKRAEEALQLTQFALDNFLDSAIWLKPDGSIAYVNRAACDTLGYSREELLSMHICDIDPNYTPEVFLELWPEKLQDRYTNFETKHVTRDGRVFPVEVTSCYTRYGDKELLITFDRDITERKLSEIALMESEERLRLCSAVARFGTFDWDLVHDRHVWSPETYEIYGVPPDTPRTIDYIKSFVYPGDELDDVLAEGLNPAGPGEYAMEYRIRRPPDGEVRWVYMRARAFFTGKGAERRAVRILGVIQDITERKNAEKALQESEERFRQLADYSPIPMAIIDEDDNITYANKKSVEVFGYTLEDVPSLKQWWLVAYPDPRYREDTIKRWENGMKDTARESKDWPLNNMVTCKDGSVRYTEIYGVSIGDKDFVLLQDVTERKLAEAELESAKHEAELYLDLMGHDINNMHQIALGYLELAGDMQQGEEQAVFINKSTEVLQRSAKLIGNVRKLQKLQEGTCQAQDVDVVLVLSDVQRECGAVPNKRIFLNVNGHEHCFVRANELLHDVYANLVTNAIKHTGDRADITVDMDVIKDNGIWYCRVMVEDNGPGIPQDKKAAVFNRTLRGTNRANGMGLGLYIVKTLVESYGGKVWAEDRVLSDYSKGAKFVVMLPVVEK